MSRWLFLFAVAMWSLAAPDDPTIDISVHARSIRPGELVVLTIVPPAGSDSVQIRAFDRDVPAFRTGDRTWEALVGIDLDVRPGTYAVSVAAGAARGLHELVVEKRTFPTRRLKVDEAFVTPPPSEQARIDREAALLAATWKASSPERLWSGPFVRPVAEPANSAFGTRSIFNGKPRNAHGGADFLSPAGTSVHSPNAGRVVVARSLYFSGNTVIVDHGLGLFSMLAHLSTIEVREGDRIEAGHVVGKVGATGRVTGPHLHWTVRAADARVDPLSLLAVLGQLAPSP
jgi:murein DD-endopeptidase MepM/ murein hydrolase activator NlpD